MLEIGQEIEIWIIVKTRKITALNNFNLVCIRENEPCGISFFMFMVFTILPFAEFYKCYINSYCINQHFKIRKLISTRYDLNIDLYQYSYLHLMSRLNNMFLNKVIIII